MCLTEKMTIAYHKSSGAPLTFKDLVMHTTVEKWLRHKTAEVAVGQRVTLWVPKNEQPKPNLVEGNV